MAYTKANIGLDKAEQAKKIVLKANCNEREREVRLISNLLTQKTGEFLRTEELVEKF